MQYGASISAGQSGLAAWLASERSGNYEMLFNLIGQGNFVVTFGKRHVNGNDVATFDLYSVSNGKIVEHWMNEEQIRPRDAWGNSGKF